MDEFATFHECDDENLINPIKEKGNYKYEMELPGIEKEDINIKIENSICVITAKRKKNKETYNVNKYFFIPENLDIKKVSTTLKNGILSISLKEKASEIINIKIE